MLTNHHNVRLYQQQRDLFFIGRNADILIENVLNDTLFTWPPIELDIDVNYGNFTFFNRLSGVEILLNSTVVAKRSSFLGLPKIFGSDTFKVDLTDFPDGQYTLQAKGYTGLRLFGRSVLSDELFITIDRSLCDPKKSFVVFTGHNDLTSMMEGQVNITWSPGFVAANGGEDLIWCGEFSYDVFLGPDTFDYYASNLTGPELISLADFSAVINRYETTNLTLLVEDLLPGYTYSFLVMAKTATGHFSDNRDGSTMEISTSDFKVKANFTRVVNIPEASEFFQVSNNKETFTVVFAGELPSEVLSLQPLDFLYFIDSDGNATMGRCTTKNELELGVAWKYQLSDLSDIFDELDFIAEYFDETSPEEFDDDTEDLDDFDPEIEEQMDAMFDRLNENVKRNLCIYTYPGSEGTHCNDDEESIGNGRRLKKRCRPRCRIKRAYKKIKKIAEKAAKYVPKFVKDVVNDVVDVVNAISDFVKRGLTFKEERSLINIDEKARLTSPNSTVDMGVRFDVYAKASFHITVSLIKSVHTASLKCSGGFGVEGYLSLLKSVSRNYKPEPFEVFKKSTRKVFFIGPVPVVVTNRPSLYVFIELGLVIEGQASAVMVYGYDFLLEYTYDRSRKDRFQKRSSFTQRPPIPQDPSFSLRLNAQAELGANFNWDILLYEIVQATAAIDIGFRPEIQVGTNVDALAVTAPYFYTLDKLSIELFVRVRILVGVNSALTQIIRKARDQVVSTLYKFQKIQNYRIPIALPTPSDIPSPLQLALSQAKVSPVYANATSISLSQLNSLVPDPFTGVIGALEGLKLDFGLQLEVFNKDFFMFGAPIVKLVASGPPQLCQGSNAIVLTVKPELTKAIIPFRNGIAGGSWYANFDGRIFQETTSWVIDSSLTNTNSVTMKLPKFLIDQTGFSGYGITDKSSLILRATPQILPVPERSLFAKSELKSLFNLANFECCQSSDCEKLYVDKPVCDNGRCGFIQVQ